MVDKEALRKAKQLNTCWNCDFNKCWSYGVHKCTSRNKNARFYKVKNIPDLYNYDKIDCMAFRHTEEE